MTVKTYQLETVSCPSCVAKIEGMLKKTGGVTEAEVLFNSSRVRVRFNEAEVDSRTLQSRITALGYPVKGER
ncbi:heavy-metal-associated domain-containing protein [Salinispira pacifica]|uniref:Copper chaperone n=1 Tax=Salinispira pacifica TaxID=1307761 RepID=V5WF70_9SPIO|nr:Copper chaperone [Salinispira pacifica]